jgi:hypothetical protein
VPAALDFSGAGRFFSNIKGRLNQWKVFLEVNKSQQLSPGCGKGELFKESELKLDNE